MTLHTFSIDALLALTVVGCWIGVLGMLRMKEPTQAMQYLALPASVGMIALTIAVFVETRFSSTAWKTLLIAAVLLAINSITTHATARAFRTRELGHWQPRDGDPFEFVPKEVEKERTS